jgi:sarcosine oxidase
VKAYDVIVVGLGGMGSAAVAHLAMRGQRVLGIERFSPPHDRGSSHGRTRVIRQAYFEDPAYVPLLLRAYELWRSLERDSGERLLELCGGLMMGAPESEVVQGSLRSARMHSLSHELLDAHQLRSRFPQFQLPSETVALFEQSAGLIFCERAVAAYLSLASRAGAALHFEERMLAWETNNGSVALTTDQDSYEAGQLIFTAGPWAPDLLGSLGRAMEVQRQLLFWFQPKDGICRFTPDRFPVYIWQPDGATKSYPYGFPALDGPDGGVKISLHHKPTVERCTPETVDRKVREDDINEIRSVIRSFLPALDGDLIHATTCLYTMTPDGHFVIGDDPRSALVKLAAGFSGHGFKFCSVVGEVLAELAIAGRTRFDIALFSPRRLFRPAGDVAAGT